MDIETRQGIRRPLQTTALLDDGNGTLELPVLDVGPEGIFLRSDLLLEEGDRYSLQFRLPGCATQVRARAEVVRAQSVVRDPLSGSLHCPGIAMRFIDVERPALAALRGFVAAA